MKKRIAALVTVLLLSMLWQATASAEDTIWFTDVAASADASAKQATVSGKVASGDGQWVTLKVKGPGGRFFLDSIKSGEGGVFTFKWNLSAEGRYEVHIGAENSDAPYQTSFVYHIAVSTPSVVPSAAPTPTASAQPTPGPPTSSGSGPVVPVSPSPAPSSSVVRLGEDKLFMEDGSKVATFTLGTGIEARIPAALLEKLIEGGIALNLEGGNFTLELGIQTLRELLAEASREGGEVAVSAVKVEAAGSEPLLALANQRYYTELKPGNDMYAFEIKLIASTGEETLTSVFEHPVTLRMKANGLIASKLSGLYSISDAGELDYLGGLSAGDWASGSVSHFSKHAVLEYRKLFADVPAGNWAYDAVTEMAAKHIVEGINLKEFAPARRVTRAEFAALLARALGLDGGSAAFTDVPPGKWYADEVAAAYQAGLVKGTGDGTFKPEQTISREEMAAMLVRAWSVLSPQASSAVPAVPDFKDQAAIGGWASDAVAQAAELGLMKGRSAALFIPAGTATRAEAAQAIANLLNTRN